MKGEVFLTLALLFLTSGVPAIAEKSLEDKETVVRVSAGAPLTLECPLRVEQAVQWQLNDSAVPADMRAAGERAAGVGRLTARLHAAAARPHHAGVYTCSRGADAHRVRLHLAAPPAPAPAAAAAAAAAPAAADAAAEDGDDARTITELPSAPVLYYDINRNLTINCSLTSADSSMPYVWKKNDKEVDVVPELKGRYKLENGGASLMLTVRANEDDYGNYSCALGLDEIKWEVHGRPVVRLPDNTNVVEGQKLKLQCKVIGKPYPRVSWTYSASEESNESVPLVEGARGGRVSLEASEQGARGGALVLAAAQRADAGVYTCRAGGAGQGAGGARDATVLRVKDMYAALWPFLGICAEVFVLCAIILVYEKRRTKPELDDSDTDNHDQKKS